MREVSAGVTYDTSALVAAERGDRRMWALHAGYLADDLVPVVPAPVLAQAWRGGSRQATLSRLLATCEVEALTEEHARRVGSLIGAAGEADVTDATVIEGAIRRDHTVVTGDAADLRRIAAAAGATLRLEVV